MEVTITNDNFDGEVLKSNIPVLVDFWAEWCQPCKMLEPVLEGIARDFDGKLKVGKINVDEQKELATRFDVISIPTLLLFKDGTVVKQHVGASPRPNIEAIFKDII